MINKNNITNFANSAIVVLIRDILELDIIIPRLIYDFDTNPNIRNGYYMYQNVAGDCITLNMQSILALKDEDVINFKKSCEEMQTIITSLKDNYYFKKKYGNE